MEKAVEFNAHSIFRIKERMGMGIEALQSCLRKGLYIEVATVENRTLYKYLVLWDIVAKKPFLLILKKVGEAWLLVTVYQTFSYHKRYDWVKVLPKHIAEAKQLQKMDMAAQLQQQRQTRESYIHVDIVLSYRDETGKTKIRRSTLGKVSQTEYHERLQGDVRRLLLEFLEKSKVIELEIPKDAVITYETYKMVGHNKKEILETGEI